MNTAQELFASYNVRDARAEAEALCENKNVYFNRTTYLFADNSVLCIMKDNVGMFVCASL